MLISQKTNLFIWWLVQSPDFNMGVVLMKIIWLNDGENCSRKDYEPIICVHWHLSNWKNVTLSLKWFYTSKVNLLNSDRNGCLCIASQYCPPHLLLVLLMVSIVCEKYKQPQITPHIVRSFPLNHIIGSVFGMSATCWSGLGPFVYSEYKAWVICCGRLAWKRWLIH